MAKITKNNIVNTGLEAMGTAFAAAGVVAFSNANTPEAQGVALVMCGLGVLAYYVKYATRE